ncbi:golgin-45 [Phlebotomus papatasi]|uniref:golgin-45 n=1 Tax=Phlebotomus papatasi TaxID=29031 RepID=UPI0024839579|nr:golgin-45 [Phlebotomus papatasi]
MEKAGKRTQGDGQEYSAPSEGDTRANKSGRVRQSGQSGQSIKEVQRKKGAVPKESPLAPVGKIFNLVPHLVQSANRSTNLARNREPRFIPFEPYKGAVTPIIPYRKPPILRGKSRNNLDLGVLVSQLSDIKACELLQLQKAGGMLESGTSGCMSDSEARIHALEIQVNELKKEKEYFEGQLKFQVQVNSELKNLLVAAVGEDIQTRVNVLTEDKLQLARALLDSANNISTHTEQIEYLAGQSEVWRSKFLASSLMVEELARWKASLTQKNNLLVTSNKQLLEMTSRQIRDMARDILRNLKFLAQIKELKLPSANAVDLLAECCNISQQLVLHSGVGMPEDLNLENLEPLTPAEGAAIKALQNSNQPLMSTDEAFRAIVGQAFPSILAMRKDSTAKEDDANGNGQDDG